MSFRATVEELKKPCIYTLILKEDDGSTHLKGLRVKICKTHRGRGAVPTVQYYDFSSKMVTDPTIKLFLKENAHTFEAKELIKQSETENSFAYVTQDELDGTVTPLEFQSAEEATKVLQAVKEYYEKGRK